MENGVYNNFDLMHRFFVLKGRKIANVEKLKLSEMKYINQVCVFTRNKGY